MRYGRQHRWLIDVLWIFLYPLSCLAGDISIQGTMLQQSLGAEKLHRIPVMHMQLSAQARIKIYQALHQKRESYAQDQNVENLPVSVDLGMENVPVLNQGIHGSCVTFAVMAAIDALLKKGDYMSPLCSLQLGRFLESYGYVLSGWNGSFSAWTLGQLTHFGFMTQQQQQQLGCGGLKEYPLWEQNEGQAMSTQEFHQHSESLEQNHVAWTHVLDVDESLMDDLDKDNLLLRVKKALNHGDRLILGILLADYERGLVGAVGTHKAFNDTWVLTPEIVENSTNQGLFAGHAMVIIGYDDEAVAKDDQGRIHHGLLKLRNSWGSRIGDQGDFYISYEYFKALVIELQQIRSTT